MKLIRTAAVAATIALGALAAATSASADTVTFETGPFGPGFTNPVTEGNFMYYNAGGALFVNDLGNPGHDMEGTIAEGGGVLGVARTDFAGFTFSSLDYSAYSQAGTGNQTLTVTGYFQHAIVAVDTFDLGNTANFTNTYDNWTHFDALNLAGVQIDNLFVTLNAGGDAGRQFSQNVDNVNLAGVRAGSAPEPASWALLLVGFGGLGAALRTRRRSAAATV
jgi:hypothetical protein